MRHRPVVCPAPGLAGRLVPCPPEGACGTTGRFTAPAAPCASTWLPCALGTRQQQQAPDADRRLRSARGWTLRLAASLTGNCRLRRPRPDRASCRAGMHLDRPPDASASISCPTADPRLSSVILPTLPTDVGHGRELAAFRPDIAAATASRCHVAMTIATRPLPERDGRNDNCPIAECKNKMGTFANYFF
jgi:hypothetical protein